MKKWLLSIVIILCTVPLTGCWDRTEVKNLALVMATGIDKAQGSRVQVTAQIAVPAGVGGGGGESTSTDSGPGKSFVFATATGRNLKDADQHLQEQLPRKLYTAHRRILIIGEDEAKYGIQDILDQFGRDPVNRMRDLIIIAKNGTADDFLKMPTIFEKIPGQEIKTIQQQEAGSIITLLDFLRDASSEGVVPIAGAIVKKQNIRPGEQPFALTNTAVMKDLKLIGYLNDKETRGVMWLKGNITRGYITATIPNEGNITLLLTSSKRKLQPVMRNGHVQFNVIVTGKGEIVENDTNLDISTPRNFTVIRNAFNQQVNQYIENAFHHAQQYDSDVFGFGQEVYRNHPRQWQRMRKHWDETFKDAKLNLSVHIEPLRTGMSGPSLQLKQDEVKQSS